MWNPIKPAKEAMFNYMDEHMPRTAATARESLRVETTKYVHYQDRQIG